MQVCIPVNFKVQKRNEEGEIEEEVVKAGDPEENENFNDAGESVTQEPRVHQFTFQGNTVNVIDTPGLTDSRGAEQDKKNLQLIRKCLHKQDKIHAICIVLKSNDSKLRNEFELALRDLLSLFPKSALKNVFFFFTYARGTFFGIGDMMAPLSELQRRFKESHGDTYMIEGENVCCVDAESFRCLLSKENNVVYSKRPEKEFEYSWNETAKQVVDFFLFIKNVVPVDAEKIKAAHALSDTALELENFIRTDKRISEEDKNELKRHAGSIFSTVLEFTMITDYKRLKDGYEEIAGTDIQASINYISQSLKDVNPKLSSDLLNIAHLANLLR